MERVQKEMEDMRSKFAARNAEVAELRARLDTQAAEFKGLTNDMAKEMRKLRRKIKKLAKQQQQEGEKHQAKSSSSGKKKKKKSGSSSKGGGNTHEQ